MKKWYNLLSRADFGMIVTTRGFQITYKGQKIGGAGIEGEGSEELRKHFEEQANFEIQKILTGLGDSYYYKAIKKIAGI